MPRNYTPRTMLTCAHCGQDFSRPPSAVAAGRGLYCCRACKDASQSTAPLLTCETCGKPFRRKASLVRDRTFCSINCRAHQPPAPAIMSDDGLTARVPLQARDGTITGYTIVDAADVPWVQQWRWQLSPTHRAMRGERGKTIYLHRELLGMPRNQDGREVDHINRDTLDNRRANLREATRAQNAQNLSLRSDNASGHRGVSWNEQYGRWQAIVNVNGQRAFWDLFDSAEDAAAAARDARRRLMSYATD